MNCASIRLSDVKEDNSGQIFRPALRESDNMFGIFNWLSSLPQVVVLQAYTNNTSVPIEAKYVFPLDDMAAGES